MSGDEMRLVPLERRRIERLVVQTENLQEVAGGLPVTLLIDVVVQIILRLLLGRPADDVDVQLLKFEGPP